MPPPRSLAQLEWEIAENKWTKARTTGRKYKLPARQPSDGEVVKSTKGSASWFYQLKSGHTLTSQYVRRWGGGADRSAGCPRLAASRNRHCTAKR